jgi:hypothetical protein
MPTALPSLEEFASATVDVLSQTPIEVHNPVFVFESGVVGLEEIPEGRIGGSILVPRPGRSVERAFCRERA